MSKVNSSPPSRSKVVADGQEPLPRCGKRGPDLLILVFKIDLLSLYAALLVVLRPENRERKTL